MQYVPHLPHPRVAIATLAALVGLAAGVGLASVVGDNAPATSAVHYVLELQPSSQHTIVGVERGPDGLLYGCHGPRGGVRYSYKKC
jgi:hypothetical protein